MHVAAEALTSRGLWVVVLEQLRRAGFDPVTVEHTTDDPKAYYPGATEPRVRLTGDRATGRLLGGRLLGIYAAEVSKRVDVLAAAVACGWAQLVAAP